MVEMGIADNSMILLHDKGTRSDEVSFLIKHFESDCGSALSSIQSDVGYLCNPRDCCKIDDTFSKVPENGRIIAFDCVSACYGKIKKLNYSVVLGGTCKDCYGANVGDGTKIRRKLLNCMDRALLSADCVHFVSPAEYCRYLFDHSSKGSSVRFGTCLNAPADEFSEGFITNLEGDARELRISTFIDRGDSLSPYEAEFVRVLTSKLPFRVHWSVLYRTKTNKKAIKQLAQIKAECNRLDYELYQNVDYDLLSSVLVKSDIYLRHGALQKAVIETAMMCYCTPVISWSKQALEYDLDYNVVFHTGDIELDVRTAVTEITVRCEKNGLLFRAMRCSDSIEGFVRSVSVGTIVKDEEKAMAEYRAYRESPVDLYKKNSEVYAKMIIPDYESVYGVWTTAGFSDSIVDNIALIKCNQMYWRRTDHRIWPIAISMMLESGDEDGAVELTARYVRRFGMWELFRYMPVCRLLVNRFHMLVSDPLVDQSALVFDNLERNRLENRLRDMLKGKTIAIVGNGPSEIGRGLGKEIDSHDVVIRFNNYSSEYPDDYGSKTDIWVSGSGKSDIRLRDVSGYMAVVMEGDYWHFPVIPQGHPTTLKTYVDAGVALMNFGLHEHQTLRKVSGITFPTSGLVAAWFVYSMIDEISSVDIYGFAFRNASESAVLEHYFENVAAEDREEAAKVHNLSAESRFIIGLISGKVETLKQ